MAPFLLSGDIMEDSDRRSAWDQDIGDRQQAYETAAKQLGLDLEQINRSSTEAAENLRESMIARGIFRSTIKDTGIADVEANRALQTTAAQAAVTSAQTALERRRAQIFGEGGEASRWAAALNQKQVENAAPLNEGRAWLRDPAPAVPEVRGVSPASQRANKAQDARKRAARNRGQQAARGAAQRAAGQAQRQGRPRAGLPLAPRQLGRPGQPRGRTRGPNTKNPRR